MPLRLVPAPGQAANEALARSQADKAALAEECAALKGRVTALEEQLAGVAAASSSTEAARASALEDASRLRGEVSAALAERNAANAEAARLRGELEAARWGAGRAQKGRLRVDHPAGSSSNNLPAAFLLPWHLFASPPVHTS